MYALIAMMTVWGNAPICAFDGYTARCFFYSYEACERQRTGNERCIPRPSDN